MSHHEVSDEERQKWLRSLKESAMLFTDLRERPVPSSENKPYVPFQFAVPESDEAIRLSPHMPRSGETLRRGETGRLEIVKDPSPSSSQHSLEARQNEFPPQDPRAK